MSKNVESAIDIIGVSNNNIACMIICSQSTESTEARKMKPQGATRVHYKVKIVHILYLMAISNPQLAIDGNSNSLSTKKKRGILI